MRNKIKMIDQYVRCCIGQKTQCNSIYFLKVLVMFRVLWEGRKKIIQILLGKYVYLRQVELVMTTKCSLRCKDCANLMQYYEKPYNVSKEIIKEEINNLIRYFDEIDTVVLVGGEPFLYADIDSIIEVVAGMEKVNRVHIFTNGTIIPREEWISALQNKKVKLIISDYGEISRRKRELAAFCKKYNIKFHLKDKDLVWGYVGDMNSRNRSEKELCKQFKRCHNICRSILNGKLYYCPRAAHGHDLGYVHTGEYEYVDLLSDNIDRKKLMEVLYSKYYFSACDYCNYGTKEMTSVKPGVQLRRDEKKNISEK